MRRSQSMYVPSITSTTQPQQEAVQITEDILVWRGQVQWTAKQNGQVFHRISIGEVTCRVFKGGTRISGEGWPSTLQMQMIPKHVLNLLGQEGYFIGSKTVIVGLQDCEAVSSLKVYMQGGHLGCVHVDSEMKNLFCPIKVFIMHYTGKGYIGVIPNDQVAFINRLRQIIQQKRNEALQKMVLQQQTSMGEQQQNNMAQQQQQINAGQQQINITPPQQLNNIAELAQRQLQQNNRIRELNNQQLIAKINMKDQDNQFHQNNIQQQRQSCVIEEISIESDGETESANTGNGTSIPDSPDSLSPENSGISNQQNNLPANVSNADPETNIATCPVTERKTIWNGSLQWLEKQPGTLKIESILRHVSCHVTSQIINGAPKVDGKLWPPRLVMQLIPKEILINICENGHHEMKTVGFELPDCEAVQSLTLLMKSGFAGCVHFAPDPQRNIKLLILLYSKELKCYLGFIPTDQAGLVTKIREVIVKMKGEISSKQAQQYKKIQAEAAAANLSKVPKKSIEVITLDDSEISENQIAGAAEKALEQLSRKPNETNMGSVHHCTAFRII